MPRRVREADGNAPAGQRLPVEVVAARLVGGLIPARHLEAVQLGRVRGQKPLLDRARDLKIVTHALKLALQLGLVERRRDVRANPSRHERGRAAARYEQTRVDNICGWQSRRAAGLRARKSR